jgi:hypothetical protein
MRCSDDYLDTLRYLFEGIYAPYTTPKGRRMMFGVDLNCKGDKMRFEIKLVDDETINEIYGDVYKIKDNVDSDSPVDTFRLLKPSAERLCDWLNKNVNKVKTPDQKIHNVVDELWDTNEVRISKKGGSYYLIEKEDTSITNDKVARALGIRNVDYMVINPLQSIFIVAEEDLL